MRIMRTLIQGPLVVASLAVGLASAAALLSPSANDLSLARRNKSNFEAEIKKRDSCTTSSCPQVANAVSTCDSSGACDFTCGPNLLKDRDEGKCECILEGCPAVGNSTRFCNASGTCDFTCNGGRKKVGDQCVCDTEGGCPSCTPSMCPIVPNAISSCTSSGMCNFNCTRGLIRFAGKCNCNEYFCTTSAFDNASNAWCNNDTGSCDFACNSGTKKVGDNCVCDVAQCSSMTNVASSSCPSANAPCDFDCAAGFKRDGRRCVCDDDQCPRVPHAAFNFCNDSGTCDFDCADRFIQKDRQCVCDPARCTDVVPNGASVCNSDGSGCHTTCNVGFKLAFDQCVCDVAQCPYITNSIVFCDHSEACAFECYPGYRKENGQCVQGSRICNSSGKCDFTCLDDFTKSNGRCVRTACTKASQCPAVANASSICSRRACSFECKKGFRNVNGACVPKPAPCTKKSIALYQGYQSGKRGQRPVTVTSVEACAAYCVSRKCVSFDFYHTNQCEIQMGGGSFDRFGSAKRVVHGVPGKCSDFTGSIPIKAAGKACSNLQVW
ncbi:BZ3500_MvSof-1268-A1-R1_Chr3-1g05471 [Microbotryum saponariae]|uniref:BZ3500_MvSof-1268-A1-R1_Chr3-1g05471 protein n=1 Tax=Microbotryum saponariae TaxID=289078 RepID=A0A2X0LHZ7_9BASI|nr:BZ3500_MvSof-1268-A1-R1_Chr3-1g05471 [Microbotryum saponariae]SDA04662.1 BZ3501_MvSof-1269-A2-R1_Chr3-1g05142 [Microbotryum saponariae]